MLLLRKIVKIRINFLSSPIINFNLCFRLHLINLSPNLLSLSNHFFPAFVQWLYLFILFLQRNNCLNCRILWNKNLHFLYFLLVSWWLGFSLSRFWRIIFITSAPAFIKLGNKFRYFELKRVFLMLMFFLLDLLNKPRIRAH